MISVSIRCYAELNDFLPLERQSADFLFLLPENTSVEMLLEKLRIPPQVVDLILINGTPVNLTYNLKGNDRIALYPVFETFDITSITKVRDNPLRQIRFVLDVHLGKLSHHLRMFGFDTLYRNDYTDNVLCRISLEEKRTLLSRDESLIENKALLHAYLIKNKDPRLQLIEVFERFDLYGSTSPFTRCIDCNSLLRPVQKKYILSLIPASVRDWCNEYQRCNQCNRIYWKGSHFKHMGEFVRDILKRNPSIDGSTDNCG
jgi:uncharacterized protein with PIN domain/sulfur carrier protein ThiS